MSQKVILRAIISSWMASIVAPCFAGESGMPVCPDLHQHETVLRDGQRLLDQSKQQDTTSQSGIGFAELGPIMFYNWANADEEASRAAEFKLNVSNLRFDTAAELSKAEDVAWGCYVLGQFSEGYDIEQRVLHAYDAGKVRANPDDVARALRTAIQCKLLIGCENKEQLKRYSSALTFLRLTGSEELHARNRTQQLEEIAYLNLVYQIESNHSANPAWSEALKLNKRLTQLHPQKASVVSLSCLIALLLEWNNQISEARETLYSADTIVTTELFQNTTMGFCQRHGELDLLRQLSSKMVQTPSSPSNTVSRYYLSDQPETDASFMFRRLISDYKDASPPEQEVRLHAIYDAMKYLNDSDEQMLNEFLVANLDQSFSPEKIWIAPLLSESAKKWKDFPNEVYLSYVHKNIKQSPSALRQFALYFASKGDYEKALTAQKAIINSINRVTKDWDSLDQRATSMDQVKVDLSAPWVMQNAQGKILHKELKLALAELSAEREKRECLELAVKLDETARRLENQDLYTKAEKMHRESLEIKLKNLGPDNAEILNSLLGLARTLTMERKYTEADAAYQKVLALYQANKKYQDRNYGTVLES